jgi:hypothetical protein
MSEDARAYMSSDAETGDQDPDRRRQSLAFEAGEPRTRHHGR